jgi:hypothetical protein
MTYIFSRIKVSLRRSGIVASNGMTACISSDR